MQNLIYIITLMVLTGSSAFAQQWRVIAEASRALQSGIAPIAKYDLDSTLYIYSNTANRGSTYNNDYVGYDIAKRYIADNDVDSPRYYRSRTERSYNMDNTINIEHRYYYYNDLDTLYNSGKDSFAYDANGRLIFKQAYYVKNSFYPYYLVPINRVHYTYDTNGNLIEEYTEVKPYNNPNYYPSSKHSYSYDANNNLLADSVSNYIYATSSWHPDMVKQYHYNSTAQLSIYEEYWSHDTGKHLSHRKYLYYNTQGQLILDSVQTAYAPFFTKRDQYEHRYTYHANGLIATDSLFNYKDTAGASPGSYTVYSYTGFDYIDAVAFYRTYNNTYRLQDSTKYYYAMYFPVSASNMTAKGKGFDAYPIPAQGFVNIKWSNDKTTTIHGQLVNVQGQVLRQWRDEVNGTYLKSINVGNLPVGNYYLVLQTSEQRMKQQIVVTQ